MTEANKKMYLNAGLFAGTILFGSMLGWGAWEFNNRNTGVKQPVAAAPVPAKKATPAPAPAVATATPPPATAPAAAPERTIAMAPAAEPMQPTRQRGQSNWQNQTPEERQAALQNTVARMTQNMNPEQREQVQAVLNSLQGQDLSSPEAQQMIRQQLGNLAQNFRGGAGGRGGRGGAGGFGGGQGGGGINGGGAVPQDAGGETFFDQ